MRILDLTPVAAVVPAGSGAVVAPGLMVHHAVRCRHAVVPVRTGQAHARGGQYARGGVQHEDDRRQSAGRSSHGCQHEVHG